MAEWSGEVWNGRRQRCCQCGRWCYWKRIGSGPRYLCLDCYAVLPSVTLSAAADLAPETAAALGQMALLAVAMAAAWEKPE